jgi:metal-dependent amidase/aminoacylase/carboxypeptidase family protein
VRNSTVYVTEVENDDTLDQQYRMLNTRDSWDRFTGDYMHRNPEIALEVSSSGKYVAVFLRDAGFLGHLVIQ